jgi:hypothetical protein
MIHSTRTIAAVDDFLAHPWLLGYELAELTDPPDPLDPERILDEALARADQPAMWADELPAPSPIRSTAGRARRARLPAH